ncbi:MAG: DUF3526 domain-containing protein [Balneolales bacterium]|nr:DUF3526 domain-containing protein [Balneolales bacterium]
MMQLLLKNELRLYLRDGVLKAVFITMGILFIVSVVTGYHNFEMQQSQHAEATELSRLQWEQQGDKNPHSAAHYGTYAFRPVSVLTVFEPGIQPFTGVSLFLEAHTQNTARYSELEDRNPLARFGELSPTFIFLYLFPLLIIILGCRNLTSERENGTFRMMLAQGVSAGRLLRAKTAGLWLVTALLYLPFIVIGLIALLFTSPGSDTFFRFAVFTLSWFLYFGVFIHLSIFISARLRSSSVAFLSLLGFWMLSTLLMPRLISNISAEWHPVPNAAEFSIAIREDLERGIDGHNPYNVHTAAIRDSVLAAHGVESPDELPFNLGGYMLQIGEEYEKMVYDYHLARIAGLHDKQIGVYLATSVFSPSTLARQLSMKAAGTDLQADRDFYHAAEAYRLELVRELNEHLKVHAVGDQNFGFTAGYDFYKTNPTFQYDSPPLHFSGSGMASLLALQLIWLIGSFLPINLSSVYRNMQQGGTAS